MFADEFLRFGLLRIPVSALDIGVAVALLLDVPIRYSNYLRDSEWAGGLLEWMTPRARRG
jgi:hypothetical protein